MECEVVVIICEGCTRSKKGWSSLDWKCFAFYSFLTFWINSKTNHSTVIVDIVLIVTAFLCFIENNVSLVFADVKMSSFLHIPVWVLWKLQMLCDCCSSALWCLLCPFSSLAVVSVCPLFPSLLCFWLFVLPDSPQSPKLLLSLNSNPPLVQGRLGGSTTGLFVGLGSNACRPECFGLFVVYLYEC